MNLQPVIRAASLEHDVPGCAVSALTARFSVLTCCRDLGHSSADDGTRTAPMLTWHKGLYLARSMNGTKIY
jgi:hypothetical protein